MSGYELVYLGPRHETPWAVIGPKPDPHGFVPDPTRQAVSFATTEAYGRTLLELWTTFGTDFNEQAI